MSLLTKYFSYLHSDDKKFSVRVVYGVNSRGQAQVESARVYKKTKGNRYKKIAETKEIIHSAEDGA